MRAENLLLQDFGLVMVKLQHTILLTRSQRVGNIGTGMVGIGYELARFICLNNDFKAIVRLQGIAYTNRLAILIFQTGIHFLSP
jgi:hypothetical protein